MDPLVHLELVVRPNTEPIAGWLLVAGTPKLAFTGYLEFMALVERVAKGDLVAEPQAIAGA